MNDNDVVIVSAARTPIGKFQGTFQAVTAPELGAVAIGAALARAGVDPGAVDEVLMGNVLQAGVGQAPARQAAMGAGMPSSVSATTVNKVCGSGLKTVMMAAQAIRAGDANLIVAGGMENMNQAPYLLPGARFGYRLNSQTVLDAMIHDGLWCPFEQQHMGHSAEWIARRYAVSRGAQDDWALESHRRALAAQQQGRFAAEIAPVTVARKRQTVAVDADETPRSDTSAEALAALKPIFDETGTVTAGNSSPISDGAAALVVCSAAFAHAHGLDPLARVIGYAQAAVDPIAIFGAPIHAVRRLAEKLKRAVTDFDLVEINEAFAAQTVADVQELGLDPQRVNVNGGAIALGHPLGCSGAKLMATLLNELERTGGRWGLQTMCEGAGMANATIIERLD
ncbi:MAG: thiolase family protein [Caldilineaceae bacterium]|nr:thiolase family protein [Caldilineaceae bacterium]